MSIHIDANPGDIAPFVLLPGDPIRAQHIAETFLDNAVCFNRVRGMLGFTGYFQGRSISVMGTGMGMPSLSIYVNELIKDFGVKQLIRVGTCGSIQSSVELGDIVLAMTASTDSHANQLYFNHQDFAPSANFSLLHCAYQDAIKRTSRVHVGGIISSDTFYNEDTHWFENWTNHQVLACEMETSALYTLALRHGVQALSILTVSDHLLSHQSITSGQREMEFRDMVAIALSAFH